jgi:hypothetical protein
LSTKIAKIRAGALRIGAPLAFATAIASLAAAGGPASAHGFIGKRFLPSTLVIEDPFTNDELSLPVVSTAEESSKGDEPITRETEVEGEYSKRITPNFALSVGGSWKNRNPQVEGPNEQSGFGNLEVAGKYQFLKNEPHELIFSIGLGVEIGGIGRRVVEADAFTTLKPGLFFGKGFGDLPDSVEFFKPIAITGFLEGGVPLRDLTATPSEEDPGEFEITRHPNTINWGFVVEYSIPYLQSFVRDIGLRQPFNHLIPLVEFDFSSTLDRGGNGTDGTINPGIVWTGRKFQLGVEGIIPLNDRSGNGAGVRAQVHFFIDDLFPRSIGKPLFGT